MRRCDIPIPPTLKGLTEMGLRYRVPRSMARSGGGSPLGAESSEVSAGRPVFSCSAACPAVSGAVACLEVGWFCCGSASGSVRLLWFRSGSAACPGPGVRLFFWRSSGLTGDGASALRSLDGLLRRAGYCIRRFVIVRDGGCDHVCPHRTIRLSWCSGAAC